MKYRLERLVVDEWCYYGTYDLSKESDINAMLRAAQAFAGLDVRAVRPTLKVYGFSDDVLVIEGAPYEEIECFDSGVFIKFSDETLIYAKYGKDNQGIWGIKVINKGTASQGLKVCNDEDSEMYSDVFEIDAEYVWHKVEG